MHLGSVKLGGSLTFYCNTHTPATGAVVDADAVPGYRVYENETDPPLLTGSMAKLDDDDTTGFYSEAIDVSTANGFEVGKDYVVRITGVVGGVTGVELHTFQVDSKRLADLTDLDAAAVVAALTASTTYLAAVAAKVWTNALRTLTQTAAQIAAVLSGTALTIQRGDTLSLSLTGLGNLAGRSKLYFAVKENPLGDVDAESLLLIEETAGLTVVNKAPHATATDGSITVTDEATGAVTITVKPAATGALPPGLRRYAAVETVIAGEVSTLTQWDRTVTITADVVRATS